MNASAARFMDALVDAIHEEQAALGVGNLYCSLILRYDDDQIDVDLDGSQSGDIDESLMMRTICYFVDSGYQESIVDQLIEYERSQPRSEAIAREFDFTQKPKIIDIGGVRVGFIVRPMKNQPTSHPAPKKGDWQTKKIFFVPQIQINTPSGGRELVVDWAGRVLQGQTIEEGVSTELNEMYGYTGPFSCGDIYFLDYANDNMGDQIERYHIYIRINADDESVFETRR